MKAPRKPAGTLQFIFIAVVLMILTDHFVFSGKRPYIEDTKQSYSSPAKPWENPDRPPPVRVAPEGGKAFFEAPLPMEEPDAVHAPDTPDEARPEQKEGTPEKEEPKPDSKVAPKQDKRSDEHSAAPPPPSPPSTGKISRPDIHGLPKIALIIDDVGMDLPHSRAVIDLPAPVTLAFLPYAPKTPELAARAKEKGHALIIHTPMEAMDGRLNIGPGGLKSGMSAEDFDKAFAAMLASFKGYEGINNHMGSRLTQDRPAMARLMEILKKHDLFFVDSKTISSSVAAQEAAVSGVPFAERDVFLDHVETAEFASAALRKAERIARRQGYAVVIGHPKDFTIEALREWIPTLKDKGIELVPVKALLTRPEAHTTVTARGRG